MKTLFKITFILFIAIILSSCGKDGCTDPNATNYNPDAKNDDNSCVILGCTDPLAENYNPDATDDNGTCTYSNSFLLNGDWYIVNLRISDSNRYSYIGFSNYFRKC